MEMIKAMTEGVLEENKEREKKEREKLIRDQEFEERREIREYELEWLRLSNAGVSNPNDLAGHFGKTL
ncbi:hypothetical protein TNCV_3142221 [Trichonephila clavipes]|nr:hypothetical protein TNCV_3142221 [Trichonephila clavipes]